MDRQTLMRMGKLVAAEGRNTMGGNWEKIFVQCLCEGLTDKVLPGEKLPNSPKGDCTYSHDSMKNCISVSQCQKTSNRLTIKHSNSILP